MKKSGFMLLFPPLLVSLAWGGVVPSMERGNELFNSTKLGTNGKSCATCHRDGNKLAQAASYPDAELAEIINQCIKDPLAGKGIDPSSSDMQSLITFIRGFAAPGKL